MTWKHGVVTGVLACMGAVLAGIPAATAEDKMVELKLVLPNAQFSGTKQPIKSAHAIDPVDLKRPPIMVPEGAANLALNKPVTASDNEPTTGDLEQVTDGDKEAAEGSYVTFGPEVQWVQIDLGRECELFAVAVWHFHSQARAYHDVVIQAANDADFIEKVHTIFSNDHDGSAGLGIGKEKEYIETNQGRCIDAKGVKARYVRLYSNGCTSNMMNDYTEVEVYGRPAG